MSNPNDSVFPSRVAADSDLFVASNRALSKLALPVDNVQTTLYVMDSTKYTAPCLIQIDTEIIAVGFISDPGLYNCIRGFANTTAVSHTQNSDVKGYLFSYHHNQVAAEIVAIENSLGSGLAHMVTQGSTAGGDVSGTFTNLQLNASGVSAGTYGTFDHIPSLTVDAKGRITAVAIPTGVKVQPIEFKTAMVKTGVPALTMSFGSSNTPTPTLISGVHGALFATAGFAPASTQYMQDRFYLPEDWATDAITLDLTWRTSATSGSVQWVCEIGKLSVGDLVDFTFANPSTITSSVPVASNTITKSRITPLTLPAGLTPGDCVFFRISRSSADGMAGVAELVTVKFNVNRQYGLFV